MQQTHASPFAGQWYPADRSELGELITRSIEEAQSRSRYVRDGGMAFVVPHAAPMYSGSVAAAAYRHIEARAPRRIVLLGFSHHRRVAGIAVPQIAHITTPIGTSSIDTDSVREVAAHWPFRMAPETVLCDHSVEIQLPFLQRAAPQASILPLYVGPLTQQERVAAASRLRWLLNDATVLVASSDLTHYGQSFGYTPFPLNNDTPRHLEELDAGFISAAGSLDPELFLADLRSKHATVCGYEPIALLLETLRGSGTSEIFQECLDYRTSGEITADFAHSVSYGALGYFPASAFRIAEESTRELLSAARWVIDRIQGTHRPGPEPSETYTPELQQRRGLFVTLYQRGELRGCIGSCQQKETLAEVIPHLTMSAAIEDTRFDPLSVTDPVDIEISILTPFKRVRGAQDLVAGEHGAILEFGDRAGILLPKVASERGWNTTKFLEALARKASLPVKIEEKPGAQLSVFRAQVFRDGGVQSAAAGVVQ